MYMTVKQAAEKWWISERRVRILCAEGKVSGATREGRSWMIPTDARKPEDGRFKATESILTAIDRKFRADEILYVGLQGIHDYQDKFLKYAGVDFKVQTEEFVSDDEIRVFMNRFDHILVHLDIDVLDAALFHSTYFANKDLVGDGSGSGKMTIEKLTAILKNITNNSDVVGLTIAEHLRFEEYRLHNMFSGISLFTD